MTEFQAAEAIEQHVWRHQIADPADQPNPRTQLLVVLDIIVGARRRPGDHTIRCGNRSECFGADRRQSDVTKQGSFHLPANHEIAGPPVVTSKQIDH
jgi:hypothetical protein